MRLDEPCPKGNDYLYYFWYSPGSMSQISKTPLGNCIGVPCSMKNKLLFLLIYFFNWRIMSLQNCVVFCQTSTRISHRYIYLPSLLNLPPIPFPSHPSRLIQSPCLSFLSHTANSCWLSILHMVMKVSMLLFPYTSPSPPLSQCP